MTVSEKFMQYARSRPAHLYTLLLIVCLAMAPALAAGGIIHVDQAATGANNGTNWADAYTDLQDALAAAVSGDEIWVAAGLYSPPAGSARSATFQLKNGVAIYGGFAGDETMRNERDVRDNVTVLSGDINNDDLSDSNGIVYNPINNIKGINSYHVVTASGTDETAILDGFIITAGDADGSSSPDNWGAGILCIAGSPTLSNITVIGNRAKRGGGGMRNRDGSNPILTNVSFVLNQAGAAGGGMANVRSSPLLTKVSFIRNDSDSRGGGLSNSDNSNPILVNVIFDRNDADVDGGGMRNRFSTPVLTNASFSFNRALNGMGGAISNSSSNPFIRNTIIGPNRDQSGTGTATASIANESSIPIISYSLVQGCNPGNSWNVACGTDDGNNLADADPLFAGPNKSDPGADLRLRAGSPALDSGDNTIVNATADLAGNARIANETVDLGAYEHPSTNCPSGGKLLVARTADQPGDGQSWATAFRDLRDALLVQEDCEIWVASGVYKPAHGSFSLNNGIAVYGGFVGNETEIGQRDWTSNITVLSGDIDSNDTTDDNGIVTDPNHINCCNSSHVVTSFNTDGTAVLDGFTVTAGEDGSGNGGGLLNTGSPRLVNLQFIGNSAWNQGGGMRSAVGSPRLENVEFVNNHAYQGGGISVFRGSPMLTNVTISGNSALSDGGGMFNNESTPVLDSVVFSENSAEASGGGLVNNTESNPVLRDVTFIENDADYGGGMINANASRPDLVNVTLRGNTARKDGGGVYNLDAHPRLTSVELIGNSAQNFGGGMHNASESAPILTNVALAGNDAGLNGGAISNAGGSNPRIRNSILWNNRDSSGTGTVSASIFNDSSDPVFSHSVVQGCNQDNFWAFECGVEDGTILPDADPRFADPPDPGAAPSTSGNTRLQVGSPAIDAGDDEFVFDIANATDLDGNPRKFGNAVDLGAYEFPEAVLDILVDGKGIVTADPDQATYPLGTQIELTAIADPGWTFADWSGDMNETANPVVLSIDSNMVITATFSKDPPVSDAGMNQTVMVGTLVTLDGSGSFDEDPDQTLTYHWSQSEGVTVTLSDPNAVQPAFTAPSQPGQLSFALLVTNELDKSAADAVTITTAIEDFHTVGGTVSGLKAPGLVLGLNGHAMLLFDVDNDYVFPDSLPDGTNYEVTTEWVPAAHDCQIANATGTIAGADVIDADVTCATDIEFADGFERLESEPVELIE